MNTGRGDQGTGQPRSDQLRASPGPAVWQQVIELLDRAFSDACEHVLEPGEWVHLRQFARGNETPQHRHRLAATIAAHEGPVAPAHRDAAQAPLGVIVVDGQVAIFQVARQRLPVLQRIGDRLAGFALPRSCADIASGAWLGSDRCHLAALLTPAP